MLHIKFILIILFRSNTKRETVQYKETYSDSDKSYEDEEYREMPKGKKRNKKQNRKYREENDELLSFNSPGMASYGYGE